jgi:hypothetical protein
MKTKAVFLILIAFFSISSLNAQKSNKKVTITGTVLNADKVPIVNAIVMIDNEKTNSFTDSKGNYKVKVKPTALKIGIFTFGQGVSEVDINGRTQIDFNFGTSAVGKSDGQSVAPGEQGVSNGYGVVKKKKSKIILCHKE